MAETLWRNSVLLGHIVVPTHAHGGIAGMFVPTGAFDDIRPVAQFRLRAVPGEPIVHHYAEDSEPAESEQSLSPKTRGKEYKLDRWDGSLAVAPEAILSLRDGDGETIECDTIAIHRFPIPPAGTPSEIWDLCNAYGVEPSGWIVSGFPPAAIEQ